MAILNRLCHWCTTGNTKVLTPFPGVHWIVLVSFHSFHCRHIPVDFFGWARHWSNSGLLHWFHSISSFWEVADVVRCQRNAFEKSNTNMSNCSRWSSDCATDSIVFTSWVSHERCCLKPCWWSTRMLCSSKWDIMWWKIICSIILQHTDVSDTGL